MFLKCAWILSLQNVKLVYNFESLSLESLQESRTVHFTVLAPKWHSHPWTLCQVYLFMTLFWVGVTQTIHWFLGGKGLDIQQRYELYAVCMFDKLHVTFNFKSKVSRDVSKNKNECQLTSTSKCHLNFWLTQYFRKLIFWIIKNKLDL